MTEENKRRRIEFIEEEIYRIMGMATDITIDDFKDAVTNIQQRKKK